MKENYGYFLVVGTNLCLVHLINGQSNTMKGGASE